VSSPVGHSLAGLNLYFLWNPYKGWKQVWEQKWDVLTAITLTNLPDVDMLLGYWIYGDRHAFHRTLTHSPCFALLLALILGFFSPIENRIYMALQYFAFVFSHGVMDFFAGDELGRQSGQGVALLYPWITKKYTPPFALLLSVDFNLGIWATENWQTVAYEIALLGGLFLSVIRFRGKIGISVNLVDKVKHPPNPPQGGTSVRSNPSPLEGG
jgi:membrane-bound metal-dependent hydrolase YbcI (DUF457 family)